MSDDSTETKNETKISFKTISSRKKKNVRRRKSSDEDEEGVDHSEEKTMLEFDANFAPQIYPFLFAAHSLVVPKISNF